jgi:hypothetical protein
MFHLSALVVSLAALALLAPEAGRAESDAAVPPWFVQEIEYLTRAGGRWITDNTEYKGEEDPYPAYGIEWQKGLSGLTVRGRLFAIDRDDNTHDLWELYLYWNPLDQRAVAMQVHRDGNFGVGELTAESDTERELVQEFWAPGGATFSFRHEETRSANEKRSRTFMQQDNTWRPNRTYVWKRDIPDR